MFIGNIIFFLPENEIINENKILEKRLLIPSSPSKGSESGIIEIRIHPEEQLVNFQKYTLKFLKNILKK